MISGCKNLRVWWRRHLVVFLPLLLVACEPEKTKPDSTAALYSKIQVLERNIEYLNSHTQSALEERDSKIQQLARGISDIEEKVKDLESDLSSVKNKSQASMRKAEELELQISDLDSKVSQLRSESVIRSLR